MTEEEKINGENNYSASNIQVLEGLEAVRKRPAMGLYGDGACTGRKKSVRRIKRL